MHIGYCRVSTDKQSASLEAQRQQLKKAGCELIYEDEDESGSKRNRPRLNKALEHIRKGDTLIVCKLDRLTRSLVDLLDILKKLENAGASFRSLGETFETESAAGRMMMNMVGCFAQYAEPAVMRSDPIEVEVWPARWPLGAPHNIQRYGSQRFRDCGEVRSKDWTVWREPGAQPVRAGLDLSWLKGPGLCVARQTDITFETVKEPCDVLHRI